MKEKPRPAVRSDEKELAGEMTGAVDGEWPEKSEATERRLGRFLAGVCFFLSGKALKVSDPNSSADPSEAVIANDGSGLTVRLSDRALTDGRWSRDDDEAGAVSVLVDAFESIPDGSALTLLRLQLDDGQRMIQPHT